MYLTPADLLARGLELPPLPEPPTPVPPGTVCGVTGQPISAGYPVRDVITSATAEFLDAFRNNLAGYVSENAARCYRSSNPKLGNPCARSILAFADGTLWMPLIAREPAREQGRPCWSELVRQVWPGRAGQSCLCMLTTDTKKRLWIRARVGALGPRTPVLYYDSKTAGNEVLLIDWPALLESLTLIEVVYNLGFPKAAIGTSLYVASKVAQSVTLSETRRLERALAGWRGRPEFRVALLIAQKAPEEAPEKAREEPEEKDGDHDLGDDVCPDRGSAQIALL